MDLTPSHNYLQPKLKENLGGKKFPLDNEIISAIHEWSEVLSGKLNSRGRKAMEQHSKGPIRVPGHYVEK